MEMRGDRLLSPVSQDRRDTRVSPLLRPPLVVASPPNSMRVGAGAPAASQLPHSFYPTRNLASESLSLRLDRTPSTMFGSFRRYF